MTDKDGSSKEISNIDMRLSYLEPHPKTKKCAYCGTEKEKLKDGKLVVIFNPNRFPNNEVNLRRKDTWTVCNPCADCIGGSLAMAYTEKLNDLVSKHKKNFGS